MSIAEKLTAIAENEQRVFDAGKAKRDYEWWDYYQKMSNGVERYNYLYAFAGSGWRDDNYNPIRPIKPTQNSQLMFASSGITDTKVTVDIACGKEAAALAATFSNATLLTTVRKFIVDEYTTMSSQFSNATALTNLTIEGVIAKTVNTQWCPLTKESILSVLNAMSVSVSGQTATFNKTAVNNAFATEEWETLIAPKRSLGWSIALA